MRHRVPHNLVQCLASAASKAHANAACAQANDQLQPVFALVKTHLADDLGRAIGTGERAMHRWLESLRVVAVDFDDAEAFVNINKIASE